MKNTFIILLVILFCGCTKDNSLKMTKDKETPTAQDNVVSFEDIYSFISKEGSTKGVIIADCKIEPYIGTSFDTLMYVINYGRKKGWVVLSSDKRTPAILAEGDKGSFVLNGDNPGLRLWMQGVAEDMYTIRHSKDEELTFSAREIEENRSFWTNEPIRIIDPPIIDDEGGHWEVTTTSSTQVYDTLGHMVPQWDQWAPYNKYCPLSSDGSGNRAPAGCVAIAGAQVLYYLNKTISAPEYMYSSASCTGNTNNFYQNFSNATTTVWSNMMENYDDTPYRSCEESILIAYVGSRVWMEYGDDGSSANDADLPSRVFYANGINCSRASYDESTVRSSLLSSMPVIVGAYSAMIPLFGWGTGHTFVIDGYKRTRTQYHSEYVWVPDDPSTFYDPTNQYASYYVNTYSAPAMTGIKINWGWWSQWVNHENDGWYTLTGGWHVNNNNGGSNYNYYRTMIYGFSIYD